MAPTDSEDPKNIAEKALGSMAELHIAPQPPNYSVWYGYHRGLDRELVGYIDSLLEAGSPFDDARNTTIFTRFLGGDPGEEAVREAGNHIQTLIEDMRAKLGAAGESTQAYGAKLASFSGELSTAGVPEALQALVTDLVAETEQVISRNLELEESLESSSREINGLRENLQEARQEAVTDALTGIANRKFFDLRLEAECSRAREEALPFCLLMIDIDHFKRFNDTYGHQIGDEVIKIVAKTLKSNVKGKDTPARYGGEEFSLLLPDTGIEDAVTLAEQIRDSLATRRLQNKKSGESYGRVTLSIGAALFRPQDTPSSLVERADKALYVAKNNGRNRVMVETAETTEPVAQRQSG